MRDLVAWIANIQLLIKLQMSKIFATQTIIYCYCKPFGWVRCERLLWDMVFAVVIFNLQKKRFLPHWREKKIFENIVNLAIEVFKKPGVEFLSFIWLKGWINNPNVTPYQGFIMVSCMKHCMVLSFHKHFTSQGPGTQRSDRAELPPLFEAKWGLLNPIF